MKKKNYLHLLAIMMVSMLSFSITSCGDDDEDENPTKQVDPVQNPVNADLIGWWTSYQDGIAFTLDDFDSKHYYVIHFVDDQVAVWYGGVTSKQLEEYVYALTINGEKYYVRPKFKQVKSYYRDKNTILLTDGGTWTILDGKIYSDSYEFIKNPSASE